MPCSVGGVKTNTKIPNSQQDNAGKIAEKQKIAGIRREMSLKMDPQSVPKPALFTMNNIIYAILL